MKNSRPSRFQRLLASLLMAGAMACVIIMHATAAESAPSPAAVELVRLTRLDETFAVSSANNARKAHAEGKLTQAQFNCVILPPRDWTDDIARYYSRALTADEIARAIRFFKSPSGRFVVNSLLDKRDARLRGTNVDIEEPPEVSGDPGYQAFMHSNLLQKVMPSDGNQAAMARLVSDKIGRALANCPGARSPR